MAGHSNQQHSDTPRRPHSLRDWYAGKALEACEVTAEHDDGTFVYTPEELAARCFRVADAMIRERAK